MYLFAGHALYDSIVAIGDDIRRKCYSVNMCQSYIYKLLSRNNMVIAILYKSSIRPSVNSDIKIYGLSLLYLKPQNVNNIITVNVEGEMTINDLCITNYNVILRTGFAYYIKMEDECISKLMIYNETLIRSQLKINLGRWIYRTCSFYSQDMVRFAFDQIVYRFISCDRFNVGYLFFIM